MKVLLFLILITFYTETGFTDEKKWPEMSLFHLDEAWKNEESVEFRFDQLAGKPALLIMAYTSCQHTCPIIISKVLKIWDDISENQKNQIHLVLVSFDSERDTPENLKKYKKKRGLSDQWILLNGDAKKVRKLAVTLGVSYKPDGQGDFSHSNVISLIDKKGIVVNQIMDLGKPTEPLTKKLKEILNSF